MSMHGDEGPPPIEERFRIPLRVGVIAVAYAVYYVLSKRQTMPAAFVGFGLLLVGLALVDRWTVWRRNRSGLLQVGMTLLGVGLIGLGAFLFLR